MITATRKAEPGATPDLQIVLPYELRTKSRLRALSVEGEEVGLLLERGTVLRGGDLLRAEDGRVVAVVAAAEEVSTIRSEDALALTRAAYHLGNRHVALQVGRNWLRYLHDHVLDDMVRGLGLSVVVERAPFEPEAGAYASGASAHGHVHAHSHAHD